MSSWYRLKSVVWFLWYHGNLQRLSKLWKLREPIQLTLILFTTIITITEMEIVVLEIFRNAQQFNFLEELELLRKSKMLCK